MEIGASLFDKKGAEVVPSIMSKAAAKGVKIILPTDFVIGDKFAADAQSKVCTEQEGIPEGWMGLDVCFSSPSLSCLLDYLARQLGL